MKKRIFFALVAALMILGAPTFGAIQQSEMQALLAQFGIVNMSSGVDNGGSVAQSNLDQQAFDGQNLAAQGIQTILIQAGVVANPGTLLMGGSVMEGQNQLVAGNVKNQNQGAAISLDTLAAKTGVGTVITGNNSAITNEHQIIVGCGTTTANSLAAAASQFVGMGPGCSNPAIVEVNTTLCAEQSQTVITSVQRPAPPCSPSPPCGGCGDC